MTETTGEIKLTKRPFEENSYKYADEQAELYRGLKEPGGGYANIVDAYIAGATKETAELNAYNAKLLQSDIDKQNKIVLLSKKVNDLQKENTKLKNERYAFKIYSDFAELDAINLSDQLTKAKEIIKMFLAIVNNDVEYVKNPKDCKDLWGELCEKAEQFLSEVEK